MRQKNKDCIKKADEIISLSCDVERCWNCGTPNWDLGSVCGNCGENPETKPEGTFAFNPTLMNQIGGC